MRPLDTELPQDDTQQKLDPRGDRDGIRDFEGFDSEPFREGSHHLAISFGGGDRKYRFIQDTPQPGR
jgi:hypothetical protein